MKSKVYKSHETDKDSFKGIQTHSLTNTLSHRHIHSQTQLLTNTLTHKHKYGTHSKITHKNTYSQTQYLPNTLTHSGPDCF